MGSEYVLLEDLAKELHLYKGNVRKYALKAGFSLLKVRPPGSRNQLTSALTPEDAEALKELRQSQGYAVGKTPGKTINQNHTGQFYIIQLIPEFEPNRVKLGFAQNAETRLQSHRTAAPTAELLKAWPCKRSWETTAIASLTRKDCEPLTYEVFRVSDLEALIKRGDAFFMLMPDQDSQS